MKDYRKEAIKKYNELPESQENMRGLQIICLLINVVYPKIEVPHVPLVMATMDHQCRVDIY